MASNIKSRSRRKEVSRKQADAKPSAWRAFRDEYGFAPLLIAIGFVVGAAAILLAGQDRLAWQLGQRVVGDIRARVDFEVLNEQRTREKREQARLQTPNIYVRNDALLAGIRSELTKLFELAKASASAEAFMAAARKGGWPDLAADDYTALKELADDPSGRGGQHFAYVCKGLTEYLANQYLVEKVDDPQRPNVPDQSRLTWNDSGRRDVYSTQLQLISDPQVVARVAAEAASRLPDSLAALRPDVTSLVVRSLRPDPRKDVYVPIYRYDRAATHKLIEQNVAAVQEQINSYKAGAVLVEAGKPILAEELALLQRHHDAYMARLAQHEGPLWREHLLRQIGVVLTALLVVAGLSVYTLFYQQRIVKNPMRVLGLALLLLGMLALTRLNAMILPKELAVGPVVIAAAILTIVYEQRYAFGITGGLAVLATLASEGDFGLFIGLLTPMAITVFSLQDIRTRGKLVGTGALAAIGAFVATAADGFIEGQPFLGYVLAHASAAGGAALMAGFIVLGVLPAIERLFGVATSLTLLEWSDPSRSLLRRLALEAPGTYTHSLMIGTLAETAADAIGANGLLVRVGALYHDIGKIAKPAYYVENQEARINRHDQLGPTLSHLVIVAHVKDGLEVARSYGLPRILHQFVAEHHGTTVVRYFQRVAAEQAKQSKTKELPESEFRYPGPKPRSRESAVLMICDGVEGAVRALQEPTPGRIETTVHQVLMDRLNDGQFDDCDITMKGLSRVEDAVVKGLCAAYHGRIAYPKAPKEEKDAAAKGTADTSSKQPEEHDEERADERRARLAAATPTRAR
jgi:putative nucleotidyltransferase with HDIG domain